jgi:hypothetical protein
VGSYSGSALSIRAVLVRHVRPAAATVVAAADCHTWTVCSATPRSGWATVVARAPSCRAWQLQKVPRRRLGSAALVAGSIVEAKMGQWDQMRVETDECRRPVELLRRR